MSQIAYRRATLDDLAALYAIECACFSGSLRFSKTLIASMLRHETCLMAGSGEAAIGFVVASMHPQRGSPVGYIDTLEVLPEYRGQGVANHLLTLTEQALREAGCASVALHVAAGNATAARLYDRHGYEAVRRVDAFYADGEDALLLLKVF